MVGAAMPTFIEAAADLVVVMAATGFRRTDAVCSAAARTAHVLQRTSSGYSVRILDAGRAPASALP